MFGIEHSPWETERWLEWLRRNKSESSKDVPVRKSAHARKPAPAAKPARTAKSKTSKALPEPDGDRLRKLGWEQVGASWEGWFRFKNAPPIRGRIERRSGRSKVYFYRPPETVQKHHCSNRRSGGWWWLHERSTPPKESVSSTIFRAQTWLYGLLIEVRRV